MKGLIRSYAVYLAILWLISAYIGGIDYGKETNTLLLGALVFTIAETFLKPIINILLLPFNLVTLGIFRWVSNVLMLYIATLSVPGFSVVAFNYPGFRTELFIVPPMELSVFWAYIALSLVISFIASFLFWLIH